MATRRHFVKQSLLGSILLLGPSILNGGEPKKRFKISLAQWSLHRSIEAGKLDHLHFPAKAKNDFGIDAVEYVNGFFGSGRMNF